MSTLLQGAPFELRNVRLLDPFRGVDRTGDVRLWPEGPEPISQAGPGAVEGDGRWLTPLLVDLAARLREPGATHKASIGSEARAALARGIGTLVLPPDTEPAIDSTAVVELILERAGRLDPSQAARVLPVAALLRGAERDQLSEMATLAQAGCVAVGVVGSSLRNAALLRRALQYVAGLDLTVMLQPLDADLAEDGVAHSGRIAARLGLPGVPPSAETLILARDLELAEETGARLHVCRLSTAKGVEMVAAAKTRGLPVTCDVAMHQLWFSELDVLDLDPRFHLLPPLRRQQDREALTEGVKSGVIDCIVSDHQPHDPDAKLAPFGLTEPGASTLDAFLGLGLKLVHAGVLSPLGWLERCVAAPAKVIGLPSSRTGWMLLDPEVDTVQTAETLLSRGHNSPFLGWSLPGRVDARYPNRR